MSCFPWELFPKYFSFVLQNCTLLSMERHCPVSQRSPWLNWGMGEHLLSPVSQHKVWPCPDCKPGPDLPTSSPSPFHILASIRRKGQRVGREELPCSAGGRTAWTLPARRSRRREPAPREYRDVPSARIPAQWQVCFHYYSLETSVETNTYR